MIRPSAESGSPEPRRRWWLAIVGSSAFHATLLLLALRAETPPPGVARPDAVSVELIETPPAAVTAAPAPAPPQRRRPQPGTSRPRPASESPAPESRAPAVPADPSLPAEPGSIALLPSADQLERAGVPLAVAPAEGVSAGKGASRWQRGLADVQRRRAGRAAIEAGQAPPEAFDLLRDMEKIYAPSHELVLDLARKHAARSRNVDRWLGRYLGGFLARPEQSSEAFDPTAAFMRGLQKAGIERSARVCATFRPGADPALEMDVSSGIRTLDALALQTVSRAALRREGQVPRTRVCYLFSARLTRIPPIPVLACGIGAHGPECIYPLKEIATTKVTLDGVEPVTP